MGYIKHKETAHFLQILAYVSFTAYYRGRIACLTRQDVKLDMLHGGKTAVHTINSTAIATIPVKNQPRKIITALSVLHSPKMFYLLTILDGLTTK